MTTMSKMTIASSMASHGFTTADQAEGWKLLQAVSDVKLGVTDTAPAQANILTKLDAWENRWFPIAYATLERRFPAVHAQVFNNISQTSGIELLVTVRTLLDRFEAMGAGEGAFGPEGQAAKTMLETRGITPSVISEAKSLLDEAATFAPGAVKTPAEREQEAAVIAKAEADLWAWYLEWSQIARVAVTQRSLLKEMGFLSSRRSADEEEDVDPVTGIVSPVNPVAPISPNV
jgi:hypothetical protein